MSELLTSVVRDSLSEGSNGAFAVCHADDVPRLRAHLMLVSALELHGLMGDAAKLVELPCPSCEAWPVMTSRGLRGIEEGQWREYCRLREIGARMEWRVECELRRRDVRMRQANDRTFEQPESGLHEEAAV